MFTKAQEHQLLHEGPQEHSSASELRVVKSVLWDAISANLNAAERDEVRCVIGMSQLDENESLFAEAGALADILGEVQLNTKELLARHSLCRNVQRSMVESEVRLLMDRLRSLAASAPFAGSAVKARDPESVVPKAGAKDKSVVDYLAVSSSLSLDGHRSPLARPATASSLSRPTTSSSLSRPSTACSGGSNSQAYDATAIVSAMQDKLNVYEIDAVKDALRVAIQEEKTLLMEDIEYLTALLTDETDMQAQAAVPPPSLSDLKDYCLKLQSAVASEEARHEHEVRVSHMFAAAAVDSSKAARLRGMISASRRTLPLQQATAHNGSRDTGSSDGGGGGARDAPAPVGLAAAESAEGGGGSGRGLGVRGSRLWSGAEGGASERHRQPHARADVLKVDSCPQVAHASSAGGGGAAQRLVRARGAVERTLPLLLHPPPLPSSAASTMASRGATPAQEPAQGVLHRGTRGEAAEMPVSSSQGSVHELVPHTNSEAAAAQGGGHLLHPASLQGGAGNLAATGADTCVEGGASRGGMQSRSMRTAQDAAAGSNGRGAQGYAHSPASLQGGSLGLGAPCAPTHAHQQNSHPPTQAQACLAGERRAPGGGVRPSSAARLRALVANPPALPTTASPCAAGHAGASSGAMGSMALQGSSISSSNTSVTNLGSSLPGQDRWAEQSSNGRGPGAGGCYAGMAAELDTQVDSLKGGVAAILSKHGLKPKGKDQSTLLSKDATAT